jgi:hypothetical protein
VTGQGWGFNSRGRKKMSKSVTLGTLFLLFCSSAFAITVVEGKVEKVNSVAKTIVVKAEDGTEHTFYFVQRTLVQGGQVADTAAKDSFHGLKEGSEVAVHYTAKGTEETAEEVDHLGGGGLKASQGQLIRLDQTAKTVTIKAQDGTEHVFQLSNHAADEVSKDITTTAQKSGKVTVYYTEKAGHQVAHFFTKNF